MLVGIKASDIASKGKNVVHWWREPPAHAMKLSQLIKLSQTAGDTACYDPTHSYHHHRASASN
jgi:hypothetical protein